MDEGKISAMLKNIANLARDEMEPRKPEWDARREIARTIISLSSATLVFTITFSPALLKTDIHLFWRYSILAYWLASVCSLTLSLGSLWISMGLTSLPIVVMGKGDRMNRATREAVQTQNPDPVVAVFQEGYDEVARQEIIALWLLRASLAFFGIALAIFTAIGVRQLVR